MNRHIYTFFLIILISSLFLSVAEAEKPFDLDVPLQAGIKAERSENYDEAVESFRKVLFIDGTNARAQYGLAHSLDKSGKKKKALREYELFMKIAQGDTFLPLAEKQRYIAQANKAIDALRRERKGFAGLTFVDINIIIVAIILTFTFLIKFLGWILELFPDASGEEKKLLSLWADKKALKDKEREIRAFPFDLVSILMFVVLIVFYWFIFSKIIYK